MRVPLLMLVLLSSAPALAGSGKLFRQAEAADTIEAWEALLAECPYGERAQVAIERIEALRWEVAVGAGTVEAVHAYLELEPDGPRTPAALALVDDIRFAETMDAGTVEAYDAYLARVPRGAHADEVEAALEKQLFAEAMDVGDPDAYDRYLQRYPNGEWAEPARQARESALYDRAKARRTLEDIRAYLERYPEGHYVDELVPLLTELQFLRMQAIVELVGDSSEVAAPQSLSAVAAQVEYALLNRFRDTGYETPSLQKISYLNQRAPEDPHGYYELDGDTGLLLVRYSEGTGERLPEGGASVVLKARVSMYSPARASPVFVSSVTASTLDWPAQSREDPHTAATDALRIRLSHLRPGAADYLRPTE